MKEQSAALLSSLIPQTVAHKWRREIEGPDTESLSNWVLSELPSDKSTFRGDLIDYQMNIYSPTAVVLRSVLGPSLSQTPIFYGCWDSLLAINVTVCILNPAITPQIIGVEDFVIYSIYQTFHIFSLCYHFYGGLMKGKSQYSTVEARFGIVLQSNYKFVIKVQPKSKVFLWNISFEIINV